MLAFIDDAEPCRLDEVIGSGCVRDDVLTAFDEIARTALGQNRCVVITDERGTQMALLLRVNDDVHGVLALDQVQCSVEPDFIDSLAPFTTTAALVMRQFQDDLSSSQVGAVIDHLAEGVLTFDEAGRVQAMNGAAEQLFGYNVDEIEGQRVSMLVAEPLASELDAQLAASGVLRVTYPGREFEGRRKDGKVFPMQVSLSDIEVQGRKLFIAIARDMTDFKAREQSAEEDRANTETLQQLARIDAVTTIANRRYFDETLEKEVRRAARDENPLALVFCDIDFFKAFNDRYGHPAGDKALRNVALAIDSCFQRAGELAARYGGEEFGVVIPGADIDQAAQLAGTLKERVEQLGIPHGASPVADTITVSVGVASIVPGPKFDPTELVDEADRALYRAKGSGRNRIMLADKSAKRHRLQAL